MGTPASLITVEEFQRIPNPSGARYELHHGELAPLPFPASRHVEAQARLHSLLSHLAVGFKIRIEFPFRPRPEHELWGADVAAIGSRRHSEIDPDGYLAGSPELVIEVLSPSNTASEIEDKEQACLESGCLEFWTVDPKRHTVHIVTARGATASYGPGQRVPLSGFGGGEIVVDDIFRGE